MKTKKPLYKKVYSSYWKEEVLIIPAGLYICDDHLDSFIGYTDGKLNDSPHEELHGCYIFYYPNTERPIARYPASTIIQEIDSGQLRLIADEDYASLLLTYY